MPTWMTQRPTLSECETPQADPDALAPGDGHANAVGGINAAMLESRQRWRDLALMTGDLCFETDAAGRFVFVAPDPVLGWPAQALLGARSDRLIAGSEFSQGFNPFQPTAAVRCHRAWLRRADGSSVCFVFAAAPLVDDTGQIIGARGVGQDVSAQEGHDSAVATALRRTEVLDHILWRMRQEVLAPRMAQAALGAIAAALGLEGTAVLDLMGDGVLPTVLHQTGAGLSSVLFTALALLEQGQTGQSEAPDGRHLLVCPCQTRFGTSAGLALWRAPGGRALDADDAMLAASATGLIRVILEHETIQREMARQARTDPLTGLLNRRAFLDEMGRRLERLDREELPGTLLYIDLDHFKTLNDSKGHDLGDEALCLTAALLRSTVRPQDLVARLGGDEFAIWMDGTDSFSAAERAEMLRLQAPLVLAHLAGPDAPPVTMSIGVATRWPGRCEDVETLMQRADHAMYDVKRAGRGHWRVSRTEEN
jgi:diguanylate cyclase (GGDEF)-like protein